jgi:large subunit ribosomal protein L21
MYAVIRVAGFQFRVEPNMVLEVPRLAAGEGDALTLDEVLLVSSGDAVRVGRPLVPGAQVEAQVVRHARTAKTDAGKYKRRKKYRRRWGFRREFTEIRIGEIRA